MVCRRGRLSAGLLVAAVLLGCSNNAPSGPGPTGLAPAPDQLLRVRLGAVPKQLDPALAVTASELAVVRQLGEPLLRPAPDLANPEPAAAAAYEVSADGLVYTFHLRDNGRYSDGRSVRAQDFVLAWRRLIDPRTASPWADIFASVTKGGVEATALDPKVDAGRLPAALDRLGVRAIDDRTLELTLPEPAGWARWVAALPAGAPVRQDILDQPGWATRPDTGVSNGPFRLLAASASEVSVGPNVYYWAGRPALNRIQFLVLPRDADAVAAYQRGELDVAGLGAAEPGPAREVVRTPELTVFWLVFNTARPPFDNLKVRQAFSMAVDRRALVRGALGGRASPASGLLPRGVAGYQQGGQQFNPEPARQLIDSSGAARDQLTGLHLMITDTLPDKAVAELAAQDLTKHLGLAITVEAVAPVVYSKRLLAGDFELAGPEGWTADYPDPQNWYDLFRSSDGRNRSRWRNYRYDLLVRQADAERDSGRRSQLYQQAEQLLGTEAPALFLYQRATWALVRNHVRGSVRTALDEWPGSLNAQRIYITRD